jgi:hypothetical protein
MLLLVLLVFAVEKRRLWSRAVEMSTVAQSSLLLMLLLMLALMLALLLSVVSRSCGSGQASKRAAMVLTACRKVHKGGATISPKYESTGIAVDGQRAESWLGEAQAVGCISIYLAAEDSLLQCWVVHEVTCFVHDARVSNSRVQHLHKLAGHFFTACVAVDTNTTSFLDKDA